MKLFLGIFICVTLTLLLFLTSTTSASEEEKKGKEEEKLAEEIKLEEIEKKVTKENDDDDDDDDDDVIVEEDEEEEEEVDDGDRIPGYPKPTYPKKPDPDAPTGKEHWKECKTSDDCVGDMHECVREKVFELESKSRCFPKWCQADSDCPLPMVCSKKPEKAHQCDFDIPKEFFRKVDL